MTPKIEPSDERLNEFVRMFLNDCRIRRLSDVSVKDYQTGLHAWSNWLGPQFDQTTGDVRLMIRFEDVTKQTIKDYIGHLTARKLSAPSINSYLRILRRFYKWLVEEELIEIGQNPMLRIKLLTTDRKIPEIVTKNELEGMVSYYLKQGKGFNEMRNAAVIQFLADSGARASEVVNLQAHNIDWDGGFVKVTHSKSRRERFVDLAPKTLSLMSKFWMRWRSKVPGQDAFFSAQSGKALTRGQLRRVVADAGRQVGFKKLTCHSFRYSCALNSIEAGIDANRVRVRQGWLSMQMLIYYADAVRPPRIESRQKNWVS